MEYTWILLLERIELCLGQDEESHPVSSRFLLSGIYLLGLRELTLEFVRVHRFHAETTEVWLTD